MGKAARIIEWWFDDLPRYIKLHCHKGGSKLYELVRSKDGRGIALNGVNEDLVPVLSRERSERRDQR